MKYHTLRFINLTAAIKLYVMFSRSYLEPRVSGGALRRFKVVVVYYIISFRHICRMFPPIVSCSFSMARYKPRKRVITSRILRKLLSKEVCLGQMKLKFKSRS